MFSEGIVEADPNPAAAVQTFSIFEKIKSEVILYIFEKYYVVDRLSFRCRSQFANGIANSLRCALGVCTGSKRLVLCLVRSDIRSCSRKLEAV